MRFFDIPPSRDERTINKYQLSVEVSDLFDRLGEESCGKGRDSVLLEILDAHGLGDLDQTIDAVHDLSFQLINDIIEKIEEESENKGHLTELALAGRNLNILVVKAAVHYSNLGDLAKAGPLTELLLELESQEDRIDFLKWHSTVISTLIGALKGADGKRDISDEEVLLRNTRTTVAEETIARIAKDRPLKVVEYLIMLGLRGPDSTEAAERLLEGLKDAPLGKETDIPPFRFGGRHLRLTTPEQNGWAGHFQDRIASEMREKPGYDEPAWRPRAQPKADLKNNPIERIVKKR